jgi:eukaryotic-like serine/threonine-protein kinase
MSKVKALWNFLRSRKFAFHFTLAVGIVIVLLSTIYLGLGNYTNHGESVTVPSFKGLHPSELNGFVHDKGLRFRIVDSIYNPRLPKGVIDQDPRPGSKVKEGRTIYLTINSTQPPQIRMPNLIDVSDRQAEAMLQTFELKLGQKIYKPDLAKNAVLDQLVDGKSVKPGELVKKGAVVDLVLGDGLGNTKVSVPNLINLTKEEALFVLHGSSLTTGAVIFDETVKDTANARVFKQVPAYSRDATLNQGEAIDLFFTESSDKIKVSIISE